ncbi:MAG: hypothetical protein P8N48_06795, partial [Bacteroidales bacterium]|nr:hypothetical protein [Bacteroidales bacterium]
MRNFLLSFLLITSSICVVFAQPTAFVTPNTVQENQAIQVFISGSSQSQFEESTFGAPAQLRLNDGNNIVTIPNNYNIWQWNSSVGADGFYTNIPALSVGTYALEVNNCWVTGGCWSVLNANAFTVTATPPQITSVSPNEGVQGQLLGVAISGVNLNLNQYSNISLNFSQYSGTSFNLSISYYDNNSLVTSDDDTWAAPIPNVADTGLYDVNILCSGGPTYTMNNAFRVYPKPEVYPNTAQQGQSTQVFIELSNSTLNAYNCVGPSGDYHFYMPGSGSVYGSQYTWNNNSNSYGYFVDFDIPYSTSPGIYPIYLVTEAFNVVMSSNFTITPAPPIITSISSIGGNPGQSLSVTISGVSIDFGDQWSGISTFRLQDANGQNIWGTSTNTSGNNLYGDITIPSNASLGSFYHLDVWDYGTSQFIRKDSAFQITLSSPYTMMPNTSEQLNSLEVFISGHLGSFSFPWFGQYPYSYCSEDGILGNLRLYDNSNIIPVANNATLQVIQY